MAGNGNGGRLAQGQEGGACQAESTIPCISPSCVVNEGGILQLVQLGELVLQVLVCRAEVLGDARLVDESLERKCFSFSRKYPPEEV